MMLVYNFNSYLRKATELKGEDKMITSYDVPHTFFSVRLTTYSHNYLAHEYKTLHSNGSQISI